MKNTMTWWGIAMLASGMAGAAISQCGDYAIRKALQYSIVQTLIQMVLAVQVAKSKNIEMILHFGFNLVLTLYACYAVPWKHNKPLKETKSSATVTNTIRFFYVTNFIFGLSSTIFQDKLLGSIPTKPYTSEGMYWWGTALIGNACILMATAQCGYSVGKKVLQYTMVTSFAAIYAAHSATYLPESSRTNIMAHQAFNAILAIVACYVVAAEKVKEA